MKIFIAFVTLIVVVCADHIPGHIGPHPDHDHFDTKNHNDLLSYRDECVSSLDIPTDLVEKYKKWEYPDDEKTQCYMKCIFEKFGIFDSKTGFDVHKIHHQLEGEGTHVDHSDDTHKKIENCAKLDGANACAKAYNGGMCFIKENLELVKNSVKAR